MAQSERLRQFGQQWGADYHSNASKGCRHWLTVFRRITERNLPMLSKYKSRFEATCSCLVSY